MTRLWFVAIALGLIFAGLVLRLYAVDLPLRARHYGGGLLWSAMVFVLVASLRPSRWGCGTCVAAASVIAVTMELLRLYHDPAFDLFRTTLAGQLLFGRIFSAWNIVVYEVGILAMARVTLPLLHHRGT